MADSSSTAMEGLTWTKPGTAEAVTTTQSGMPTYDGQATGFQEWQVRVLAKYDAYEDKEDADALRKELASKVLDGLTGNALTAAMDLGREKVVAKNGVPNLVQKIKESLRGKTVLEVKDLYKEGARNNWPISQQKGEPMSSYTSRRRRWYNRFIGMDDTFKLPVRGYWWTCSWSTQDSQETSN